MILAPRRPAIANIVVVVAIIVVLAIAITGTVIVLSPRHNASTDLSTSSSTFVTISGNTFSAQCPGSQSSGFGFGFVTTGPRNPAIVCLQLYYYNSPFAPVTLNLTSALSIEAVQYISNGSLSTPRAFDGASNFTVVATPSQLTIGGPKNESEGAMVAFIILGKPGASGTYEIGLFSSPGLPTAPISSYLLGAQEPESCGVYGQLLTGGGRPNYAQEQSGCITYDVLSPGFTLPQESPMG